jgi:monoamine oxidase
MVAMRAGRLLRRDEPGDSIDQVMEAIKKAAVTPDADESFTEFLDSAEFPSKTKQWATAYVEGFNAAEASRISVASLAEDARAGDEIDRDRSFRVLNGYDAVAHCLIDSLPHPRVRLNRIVHRVQWGSNAVRVHHRSSTSDRDEILACRRLIVTIPLGVLQANEPAPGAITFDPPPGKILEAAKSLAFGNVYRVTLRFDRPFWESHPALAQAGFVFSQEAVFPTWWTTRPVQSPVLTGWSAGPAARPLLGRSEVDIAWEALASLTRITGLRPSNLEAVYFHDWNRDPLARGAYSYVPAGALPLRRILAQPVDGTLFFAGEATDLSGNSGTVHGAITSGKRVAAQLLASIRNDGAFARSELQHQSP